MISIDLGVMTAHLDCIKEGICPRCGSPLERCANHGHCNRCNTGWAMAGNVITVHTYLAG